MVQSGRPSFLQRDAEQTYHVRRYGYQTRKVVPKKKMTLQNRGMHVPQALMPALFHASLTCVKLKAILSKGMTTAPCLGVLLQDQDSLASFSQNCSCSQAPDATANHHHIQVLWHLTR